MLIAFLIIKSIKYSCSMIASVKVINRITSSLNSALVEISLMISERFLLSARSNRLHNKITLKYF